MYIFKNALSNIRRSKGRSILFGIIVFIIAISACLALSVRQAAETTRAEGLKNLSITGSITLDMDKAIGEGRNKSERPSKSEMKKNFQASQLSLSELQKYSKLSSVKDFYYTGTTSVDASKIDAVSGNKDGMGGGMMGGPQGQQQESGDFTITGYSSDAAMTDFADGNAEITKGKLFTEGTSDSTCVISNTLAKYNSLSVGDTIKFKDPSDSRKTFKVKIVGIYKQTSNDQGGQSNQSQDRGMFGQDSNNIYMSYNALSKIAKSTGLDVNTRGTYSFADYASFQKFKSQAHKAGLSDKYTVESRDVSNYERQLQPLDNLSTYAKYFLIIMLVIGGAVLLILTMFSIRERKYEIGVLAAIGMNKKKIGRQFIYEIAAISIVAIMLGGLIGSLSSVPVTNALLSSTVNSQTEESFDRGGPGDGGQPPQQDQIQKDNDHSSSSDTDTGNTDTSSSAQATTTYADSSDVTSTDSASGSDGNSSNASFRQRPPQMQDYVDSVTSAANLQVIIEMMLIGLALIGVSGTAAMAGVMRYDPLSILTTRD